MKRITLTLLLLFATIVVYGQSFIYENGIIKCDGVEIGTTGTIFGEVYEAVDRNLLFQRRNQGADLTKVCVSNVTDMSGLFSGNDTNQPIGNWDVSNVTNMRDMFNNSQFNQSIDSWDVSSVVNMVGMFKDSDFNQPIGNWDVSSVVDMHEMFRDSQFNQPIGNWNTVAVTDMSWMFYNSIFNQDIGEWDVSSVIDMNSMFRWSQFNQPIGSWNVISVADMSWMFQDSQFNQPISEWDVSAVTNMSSMFRSSQFNQPIGEWDVSNVTNMDAMFYVSLFNKVIENWNVSSVTNMSWMFKNSEFNQPIGSWDVSNVTNMSEMFRDSQFNQNINEWCVRFIPSEPSRFSSGSPLTAENKPVWGTCSLLVVSTPSIPVHLLPENNSVDVASTPVFGWTTDSLSTKYQIRIFQGFDPIVIDTLLTDSVFTSPITLIRNTDYYWRVRGINENVIVGGETVKSEWSSVWKFTTDSTGTNPPIVIDENGTVRCEGEGIGFTWLIDGISYEVVDRDLLIQRRDEGADLTKKCVSNITDMSNMFQFSVFNQPIGNWDVSNVTDMRSMFDMSNFNQPIGNWDVSSVTDMTWMFFDSPFNQPIEDWNVSAVLSTRGAFAYSTFNQPIRNWDVSNVTNMGSMFQNSQFNQPIENWDVSSVTNMGSMFYFTPFNQPIGNWDVSNVNYMSGMFEFSQFNQTINEWCVTNIPSEPDQFSSNSPLTEENKPVWGTCPATNSQSFDASWNLVSVPVEMEDYSYTILFPNSTEGTLYSYVDGYILEETLTPLKGYWINLTEGDSTMFSGERLFPTTLSLQSEWNLIGSVSEQTSISDPNEIIIPGTLYGYNSGYFPAETIESGRGYWVNTLSDGDVELVRHEPTETPLFLKQPLRSSSVLSKFDEIQFFHQDKLRTELYFNGEFGVDVHPLQTKLPPIPPKGSFDVRTESGEWITEQSQIRIRIQQTDSPVEMVLNGEHLYRIEFLTDEKQPIGEYRIVDNSESIPIPTSSQWMDIQLYEIEQNDIPTHFTLSQNYPNPFNPSTRIEFSLPASVPVKLSVYTITGQLVSTLVNEPLSVGTHSVSFDGSSYPSGVYLYRLQTPSFTQSKLMNLIK